MLSETNFTHVPLVIDIVFRCFGVYLSFNKKPTAELGKRNSWMTTIAEEGNPGYGWFCFPVLSDRQRNLYYAKKLNSKLKLVTPWSLAFSRAFSCLVVFTLSSHWLLVIFSFVLIGREDNFGFLFHDTQSEELPVIHQSQFRSLHDKFLGCF